MRSLEQLIQDAEPFPDKLVQKLPPRGDSYVPWYQYAQRLLLQHPGHSWRVTSVMESLGVWVVVGELDLTGPERVEVGTTAMEYRNVYAAVGEDDSPASAESNAYKRACAKAGIGLHLYDEAGYWLHGRLQKDGDDE